MADPGGGGCCIRSVGNMLLAVRTMIVVGEGIYLKGYAKLKKQVGTSNCCFPQTWVLDPLTFHTENPPACGNEISR